MHNLNSKLSILIVILLWGCRNSFFSQPMSPSHSTTTSAEASEASKIALGDLVQQTRAPLIAVTQEIKKKYPPNQYNYIFVGRSPGPLFALLGFDKNAHAVPFSEARGIPWTTFDLQGTCEGTFWLKKVFDHFDIYLGRLVSQLKNQSGMKKVLVIDYAFLGESVGVFLKFINLYFRYHAHLSGVRAIVPTTEYFVMTSLEGDFNTGRISSRIGEWNTPIQEGYLEKLVVKVVPPGQSLGQKRVVINPITWTKALNSPPLGQASSSRWLGTVHTIKDPKLIEAFEKQYFDFYSPYGSWSLEKSPLEITQPAYRQEFWQFRNLILGSTADQ